MHQLDPAIAPGDLARQLPVGARRLAEAVRALYAGSWDDCCEDLRRRQAGRPYLFRLDLGLEDPLAWAQRLRDYEAARGERLADVLTPEDLS